MEAGEPRSAWVGVRRPAPERNRDNGENASALEKQFEHAVGMLLGIDSVLLAMQEDQTLDVQDFTEEAAQELPRPLNLRGAQLPWVTENVPVEPLARRVPEECFYVRCGAVANYLWLRSFVTGWGGSLREIVSRPAWDFAVRPTLERQLALDPALAEKLKMDDAISDMALIGCDTLFRDGAAVGVLFEAKDSKALTAVIRQQREAIQQSLGDVQIEQVEIADRFISQMRTDDNRVRSFYAVDGPYHLVTNSTYLVSRFFEVGQSGRSLASLNEFLYAKQQTPERAMAVFIYLSDPFFTRLISPAARIEMARRTHALSELKQLRLARLAAQSEKRRSDSLPDLIDSGFLSPQFGQRADNARPQIEDDGEVDSLRGRPGVFLPVADVAVAKASRSEIEAYYRFTQQYQVEWRAMDPVVVTLAPEPIGETGLERVRLDIHVTPYAQQRYQFFARHVWATADAHVASLEGDLLALTAKLIGGSERHARVGLQDAQTPFEIAEGHVVLQGDFEGGTFFDRNFYGLTTPGGLDGLRELSAFSDSLQGKRMAPPQPRHSGSLDLGVLNPLAWVVAPMDTIVRLFGSLGDAEKLDKIEHHGDWTAYSASSDVRSRVLDQARLEPAPDSAPLRLWVGDAQTAAVWPYLQAYTFMEARTVSARNARLLDLLTQQLGTPSSEALSLGAYICGGRAVCPLGGEYGLIAGKSGLDHWVSSAWPSPSLYDERKAPPDYRFAFLDWLRGMEAEFRINSQSLQANVALTIQPARKPGDKEARQVSLVRFLTTPVAVEEKTPDRRDQTDANQTVGGASPDTPINPTQASSQKTPVFPATLRAGDVIVVRVDQTPLKVGADILARLPRNTRLTVAEVDGLWIGVAYTPSRKSIAGWVHASHTAPK